MKSKLEKKLKGTDWQVGNASDFLQLRPQEATMVEIRLASADTAKKPACNNTYRKPSRPD